MPGRIRREDVAAVRERARIEEIVGEHVTLRPAGVGSMKGLCPFHDERTPSFHVRPQVGLWHCFGCGEGGDVISFLQKIDGLAVHRGGRAPGRAGRGARCATRRAARRGPGTSRGAGQRLIEAHRFAAEYFAEQLAARTRRPRAAFWPSAGSTGRRPSSSASASPRMAGTTCCATCADAGSPRPSWSRRGWRRQGNRGVYDRFRGRLVWPIRDVTGDTVGFGARKLFEDDQGPKYLNTPETALYKKAQVLYGIDLAKREIAKTKQVVVVEGYTDVMAAHLSGVGTAVATCGTAFGPDHVRVVRRLLGDGSAGAGVQLSSGRSMGGEVVFTFDGDEAGQKAALRAFGEDQRFYAQTFVAISPGGMDPCELRQAQGPDAVKALVAGRQPLFEFVVRSTLRRHDLDTAEGRVQALREAAPVVAGIRDTALRPEYARMLAGWLGMEGSAVERAVQAAGRAAPRRDDRQAAGASVPGPEPSGESARPAGPDRRDPVAMLERQVLEAVLQNPTAPGAAVFDELDADAFTVPALRAVHEAVRAAGGVAAAAEPATWLETVREEAASTVVPLVAELAVTPLPEDRPDAIDGYVAGVVRRLAELGLTRRIADARGRLQRMAADDEGYAAAFADLIALEGRRRALRDED